MSTYYREATLNKRSHDVAFAELLLPRPNLERYARFAEAVGRNKTNFWETDKQGRLPTLSFDLVLPLMRFAAGVILLLLAAALVMGQRADFLLASDPRGQMHLRIFALTQVGPGAQGYMADPQPVRLAPQADHHQQIISGTTKAILRGGYPPRAGSFSWTPLEVNAGTLREPIASSGAQVTNIQNTDLFQDDAGNWHAAVTIGISSTTHPRHWTVIAHAHPNRPVQANDIPLSWSADKLLAGSLTEAVNGNYDGKYYEENGKLYLLYVKGTAPAPALRNAIVLQPMADPWTLSTENAVTLLTPGNRDGGLDSERYGNTQAKLVEAPYITRVSGKYALVYSTGAYLTNGYKTGVAWSDTLLPNRDMQYRKVLMTDAQGVWGKTGRREVRYLLQSQRGRWPDYVATQVIGPGVAAAVQGPGGALWLYFNGFDPNDMPRTAKGAVDGSHRRPYGLRLNASISASAKVASVSDAELASWLQPY